MPAIEPVSVTTPASATVTSRVFTALDESGNVQTCTVSIASSAPIARFNRVDYTAQSLPEPTGRYSVIDTQFATANGVTKAVVNSIRQQDPACKVLCYMATDVVSTAQNNGITMLPWSTAQNLPSSCWLYDANDAKITFPYAGGTGYRMDISDPKWQQTVANFLTEHVVNGDFHGGYADGIGPTLAAQGMGGVAQPTVSPAARTDASWRTAWTTHLATIRASLNAQGRVLFGNVASGGTNPAAMQQIVSALDGWEEEMFALDFNGKPQPLAVWQQQLANVLWSEARGKPLMLNCDARGNLALAQYALCSALLVMGGNTSWCTDLGVYGEAENWLPIDQQAQQLGAPLGSYSISGGVYGRQFAATVPGGTVRTVKVDPVAHTGVIV